MPSLANDLPYEITDGRPEYIDWYIQQGSRGFMWPIPKQPIAVASARGLSQTALMPMKYRVHTCLSTPPPCTSPAGGISRRIPYCINQWWEEAVSRSPTESQTTLPSFLGCR